MVHSDNAAEPDLDDAAAGGGPEAAEDPRRAREEARLELQAEADLGPGRIAASATEAPIMLAKGYRLCYRFWCEADE